MKWALFNEESSTFTHLFRLTNPQSSEMTSHLRLRTSANSLLPNTTAKGEIHFFFFFWSRLWTIWTLLSRETGMDSWRLFESLMHDYSYRFVCWCRSVYRCRLFSFDLVSVLNQNGANTNMLRQLFKNVTAWRSCRVVKNSNWLAEWL